MTESERFWDDYQKQAMRTSLDGHDKLLNGELGLIGETGEIVDTLKKWMFQSGQNASLPKEKLTEEVGDVLWYVAELCEAYKLRMSSVMSFFQTDMEDFTRTEKDTTVECAVWAVHSAISVRLLKKYDGKKGFKRRISMLLCELNQILADIETTLQSAAISNIEKLRKRYPDGFDPERSLNRPQS